MLINVGKSRLSHNEFTEYLGQQAKEITPYPVVTITKGFKLI